VRAVRIHAFGTPLRVEDVPEPEPGPGEVLFEATFIGVNPLDVWLTQGSVAGGGQRLPLVPGSDAAGTVNGRPVMIRGAGLGSVRDGLYRERAAVPAEAVVDLPAGVPPDQAAGLGVAGTTAWCVVHDVAHVTPDDRVLVLGASGGVGSLVVQLAKAAGATVHGQTSHPDKADFVAELGADAVVVSADAGLTAAVGEFAPSVAFDPLAGPYTGAAVAAMPPFGRLVLYGASAGPLAEAFDLRALYRKSIPILTYSGTIEPQARLLDGLRHALQAVASGALTVPIDEVLPLERAQEALERIVARRVRGKLLLRP
jgi:NADPH2:quinone reductase